MITIYNHYLPSNDHFWQNPLWHLAVASSLGSRPCVASSESSLGSTLWRSEESEHSIKGMGQYLLIPFLVIAILTAILTAIFTILIPFNWVNWV